MNKQVPPMKHAKLFKHGGSQAVRLPNEFRMPGDRVRISRVGRGVLIEPDEFDPQAWLIELRAHQDPTFMENGREQPENPDEKPIFD